MKYLHRITVNGDRPLQWVPRVDELYRYTSDTRVLLLYDGVHATLVAMEGKKRLFDCYVGALPGKRMLPIATYDVWDDAPMETFDREFELLRFNRSRRPAAVPIYTYPVLIVSKIP